MLSPPAMELQYRRGGEGGIALAKALGFLVTLSFCCVVA